MDDFVKLFISFFEFIKSEYITAIEVLFSIIIVLFFFKFYGILGMAMCSLIMLICTNIQALKISYFEYFDKNFALGSATIASAHLISDITTEHYGKNTAIKITTITAISQIIFIIFMLITISYNTKNITIQQSMQNIFIPQVRILFASVISYFITQIIDILCFSWIAKITKRKMIWLRANISNFISQMIDTIIFSILCWKIFASEFISTSNVFIIYITFGFLPRFVIGIITTPIIYITYLFKKNNDI